MMSARCVAALVVVSTALFSPIFSSSALAQAPADRWWDTPTGYTYVFDQTSAQVNSLIGTGQRIINIERRSNGRYNAVGVTNSGAYQVSGSVVLYQQSLTNLSNYLGAFNRRVVDLEVYETGNTEVFNAVTVPNSDVPGWGWLIRVTPTQINSWIANSNPPLRLVDLEPYDFNGTQYWTAVAVNNTGSAAAGWWYYYNRTAAQITTLLQSNAARLIDIELSTPSSGGNEAKFTIIMIANDPGGGWWYPGLSAAQLGDVLGQNGARLTCLEEYTNSFGSARYAVAMVDNVSIATREVRDYLAPRTDGTFGFKVKRVNSTVYASLQEDRIFEPASTIKILHATYAISLCADGFDSLSSQIFVDDTCNPNECPDLTPGACGSMWQPLSTVIQNMIRISDNNATNELKLRYTQTSLNNFAFFQGLNSTRLNHTLGCLTPGIDQNNFTPRDACSIYEQIANGSIFNSTWKNTMFNIMGRSLPLTGGNFETIVRNEAASTNLLSFEIDDFLSTCQAVSKAGGYDSGGKTWRSRAGWVSMPSKVVFPLPGIEQREYVLSAFIDEASSKPLGDAVFPAYWELMREPIRQALKTWDDACTVPSFASQPSSAVVTVGQSVQFSAFLARGAGATTYEWFRDATPLSNDPGHLSGATTSTLSITGVLLSDAGDYWCRATRECGNTITNQAELVVLEPCLPDLNGDGILDNGDINAFITLFLDGDPASDMNGDGILDNGDIGMFISLFLAGC